jgi:calcyclin binding protein
MKVKSNSLTLELKKAKKKYWDDIKEKKSGLLGTAAGDKKKDTYDKEDPGASLMSMMKDLYEKGDDNMKRTIAESWQKSQ